MREHRVELTETQQNEASGTSDIDSLDPLNVKTRYTLQVASAVDEYINAFIKACNGSHKAQLSAAVHPDAVQSALLAVNLDDVLGRASAHRIFCESYGIRSWIMAPEDGVRGLLRASLKLYEPHLLEVLKNAHTATVSAARAAADAHQSQSPAEETLQQLLLDQALSMLDEWQDRTREQLNRNVHAEAEFPAPEKFSALKARLNGLMREASAKRAVRQMEEYKRMLGATLGIETGAKQYGPRRLEKKEAALLVPSTPVPPAWSEIFMGWLDKCNRHGLWQRRWFALSLRQQRLWWFGHPEEQPARGVVHLAGAKLLPDVAGGSFPSNGSGTLHALRQISHAGAGHTTFRLLLGPHSTQGGSPTVSRHNINIFGNDDSSLLGSGTKTRVTALTLRATTAAGKKEWCQMLEKGISGVHVSQNQPDEATASVPVHALSAEDIFDDSESPVERKISTKVFANPEDNGPSGDKIHLHDEEVRKSSEDGETLPETVQQSMAGEEEEQDDEVREARERALFEEISGQTGRNPTAEEWEVLECVVQAVREYMGEVQGRLTDQASKVIADGMLPVDRTDELHGALLRVLVPAEGTSSH